MILTEKMSFSVKYMTVVFVEANINGVPRHRKHVYVERFIVSCSPLGSILLSIALVCELVARSKS